MLHSYLKKIGDFKTAKCAYCTILQSVRCNFVYL